MSPLDLRSHLLSRCIGITVACLILGGTLYLGIVHMGKRPKALVIESSRDVQALLETTRQDQGRPTEQRYILARNLPDDLDSLPSKLRQEVFIALLVPHLRLKNQKIQNHRNSLKAMHEKRLAGRSLDAGEKQRLLSLARHYGLKNPDLESLLLRIDEIPLSLALAQAILESGWGTSRFAVTANALFGVHLPENSRAPHVLNHSGTVKVAAYNSLADSVAGYYSLLNRGTAYRGFREARAQGRKQAYALSGYVLAESLLAYSSLGRAYIDRLQIIIRQYDLEQFDTPTDILHSSAILVRFSRNS